MRDLQEEKIIQLGGQLISRFDPAQYELPEGEREKVRLAEDYTDDVIDSFHGDTHDIGPVLPWSKTHQNIRFRPGEFSVWAGVNGHGKSMVLSQAVLGFVRQNVSACIASLEMKPLLTMRRMSRQALGVEEPTADAIRAFADSLNKKLWLYDQQGTVNAKTMLALARYCREEIGVEHFVIDSLMKCGLRSDDYDAQKRFIDSLTTYARDSGLHVHLVAHSRKTENEKTPINKFDVKGAGEITDMADNVFSVWRNKKKEQLIEAGKSEHEHDPDAMIRCDKQRNGEWEGSIPLWFQKRALQYVARQTTRTMDFMSWPFGEEL